MGLEQTDSSQVISSSSDGKADNEDSTASGGSRGRYTSQEPRPWSAKISRMQVITPPKGTMYRTKRIREQKRAVEEILNSAPYIDIEIVGRGQPVAALVDTGADWSLMDYSEMTREEKEALQEGSDMKGRGVSGEEIDIVGEVWRDISLGRMLVKEQRFVAVRGMTSSMILGADFWARVSPISIDFPRKRLVVCDGKIEVDIHAGHRMPVGPDNATPGNPEVRTAKGVSLPASSERFIACSCQGYEPGSILLFEPKCEENPWGVPYAVVRVSENGESTFRIKATNLSEYEQTITEGEILGTVCRIQSLNPHGATRRAQERAKVGTTRNLEKLHIGKTLSREQRLQLMDVLQRYSSVFYSGGPLPLVDIGIEHSIRLKTDTAPIAARPRRLSPEAEQEVRKEIEKLTDMGVIRQSSSPWAAPVVCARRADGNLRLALDYRRLNEASVPATLHPIPLIEDLLDRLGDAKFYSVLDAKSGYHQMPIPAKDSEVTAFVVPWGQYEWAERTPFGLKGAGYSFQRMMATILGSSNFVEALCYLDDILIWGDTWEVHLERLELVMGKVRGSGLALSPEKCKFGVDEVKYLGSVIKAGMVSISQQRVDDLRGLMVPTTVRELRRVLGAFSFVQRWLPGVADVAKPLNAGVKGKPYMKLVWTEEMDKAFFRLKQLVADATALKIPNTKENFTLITDCSDQGAGAVLTQTENGMRVPVAYYHHTLTPAEQKYTTTDKELMAVVLAVKKFRVTYLTKKFSLITDHQAVRWLSGLNIHDEKGRRGRWVEFLQDYDMELIHRAGSSRELSMADYLSRAAHEKACAAITVGKGGDNEAEHSTGNLNVVQDKEPTKTWQELLSTSDIVAAQKRSPAIQGMLKLLQAEEGEVEGMQVDESVVSEVADIKVLDRMFVDGRGLLMITFNGGRRTERARFGVKAKNRIVLPRELISKVLKACHSEGLGGHMGIQRTWVRVRNTFYWRKMYQDVEDFVKGCELCQMNKHSTHPNVAPLQETDVPLSTIDHIQLDFLGPFPVANTHPFRYILQIQDILSRYVMFIPAVNDTADTAARLAMNHWVCTLGVPVKANTDRGTHFTGAVFEALCRLVGIRHDLGAPMHPESQGQCERQNQLMAQVRCVCENNVEEWPDAVYRVAFAHNAAESATTGIPPLELLLGQEARTPEFSWLQRKEPGKLLPARDNRTHAEQLLLEKENAISRMICEARDRTKVAQLKRIEARRTRGDAYKLGDVVRIKLGAAEVLKRGKKLARRYSACYKVIKVVAGGWTYELQTHGWKGRNKTRHFNDLRGAKDLVGHEKADSDTEVITTLTWRKEMKRREERAEKSELTWRKDQDGKGKNDSGEGGRTKFGIPAEKPKVQESTVRRSSRAGKPPERLQVGTRAGSGKSYAVNREIIVEESESEEGSFVSAGGVEMIGLDGAELDSEEGSDAREY